MKMGLWAIKLIVSYFPYSYFHPIDDEVSNPRAMFFGRVHGEHCSFPQNVCLQHTELWGSEGQQQKGPWDF